MFLMLLACQKEPLATVELDALPELWVGVSPDNLSMLYFLSRHSWADEDCPDVTADDTLGTQISANNCTDDWGNTWDGDIGIFPSEGYADFESFRVQYEPQDQLGVVRDWTYDGEVTWSVSAETGELRFTVDGTIDYISTGGPLEADTRMDVQADAQLNRQVTIMDFGSGEVVLPEWGRVEWENEATKLDGSWGCEEPTDGIIKLTGLNTAVVHLSSLDDCGCAQLELNGERQDFCETSNKLGYNLAI